MPPCDSVVPLRGVRNSRPCFWAMWAGAEGSPRLKGPPIPNLLVVLIPLNPVMINDFIPLR